MAALLKSKKSEIDLLIAEIQKRKIDVKLFEGTPAYGAGSLEGSLQRQVRVESDDAGNILKEMDIWDVDTVETVKRKIEIFDEKMKKINESERLWKALKVVWGDTLQKKISEDF